MQWILLWRIFFSKKHFFFSCSQYFSKQYFLKPTTNDTLVIFLDYLAGYRETTDIINLYQFSKLHSKVVFNRNTISSLCRVWTKLSNITYFPNYPPTIVAYPNCKLCPILFFSNLITIVQNNHIVCKYCPVFYVIS